MQPWRTYSDRFLSRFGIVSVAHADSRVGPLDDLAPPDALRAFARCREEDRAELAQLLADPLHRLLVKLLMFLEAFEDLALEEFLRVEDLDLHRELVYHLPRAARRSPQRGALAIEAARSHADSYVRARVLVDLGESALLPCKPPVTGEPQ